MKSRRILGTAATVVAFATAVFLYTVHPVKSSDHQDTYNLATRSNTSADITDVFVFPSPANPNNVVFAVNVWPLIPAGMGTTKFFDPSLMWQIKIAHGAAGSVEDQVLQFGVSGTDANQTVTLYGPAKPNEVSTTNTFVAATGTTKYNAPASFANGISIFAGPRADPFYFDLFQFFSFLGDRNASTHNAQSDPGAGNAFPNINGNNVGVAAQVAPAYSKSANPAMPTFNGFPSGTMSGTGPKAYACSINPPVNALNDIGGGFNVLTFVVEVPKTLLTTNYNSSTLRVWATVNSSTGS